MAIDEIRILDGLLVEANARLSELADFLATLSRRPDSASKRALVELALEKQHEILGESQRIIDRLVELRGI